MCVLRISLFAFVAILILSALPSAAIRGSFRGKIVESAETAADPNWIYVQGRNGMIRRVDISQAQVEYEESVPAANRLRKPQEALIAGAEVRVTAEQGSDGEWRASLVEILNSGDAAKSAKAPPQSDKN